MLGPSFFLLTFCLASRHEPCTFMYVPEAHATKKVKAYMSKYLSGIDVVHALHVLPLVLDTSL